VIPIILTRNLSGVFRLPSDDAFSTANNTVNGFRVFSDPTTGQATWNAFYATAYVRLSLLGVNNINQLTDCTHVLPAIKPTVPGQPTQPAPTATSTATVTPTPTSAASATPTAKGGKLKTLVESLACTLLGICKKVETS
jgi:hypothetical protein